MALIRSIFISPSRDCKCSALTSKYSIQLRAPLFNAESFEIGEILTISTPTVGNSPFSPHFQRSHISRIRRNFHCLIQTEKHPCFISSFQSAFGRHQRRHKTRKLNSLVYIQSDSVVSSCQWQHPNGSSICCYNHKFSKTQVTTMNATRRGCERFRNGNIREA